MNESEAVPRKRRRESKGRPVSAEEFRRRFCWDDSEAVHPPTKPEDKSATTTSSEQTRPAVDAFIDHLADRIADKVVARLSSSAE